MRPVSLGLASCALTSLLAATAGAQPAPLDPEAETPDAIGVPPRAPTPASAAPARSTPTSPAPASVSEPEAASAAAEQSEVTVAARPAEQPARNALYVELAGNGGFYSVNYERFLGKDASIRAGMMYMSMSLGASGDGGMASAKATWMSIPLMFQYLGLGAGSHALEVAGGINLMYMSGAVSTFDATSTAEAGATTIIPVGTATLGYRYSAPTGGFLFRAGYTPLFFVTTEIKQVFHWGGMSFGYRFR
jgi:hypothetical protein